MEYQGLDNSFDIRIERERENSQLDVSTFAVYCLRNGEWLGWNSLDAFLTHLRELLEKYLKTPKFESFPDEFKSPISIGRFFSEMKNGPENRRIDEVSLLILERCFLLNGKSHFSLKDIENIFLNVQKKTEVSREIVLSRLRSLAGYNFFIPDVCSDDSCEIYSPTQPIKTEYLRVATIEEVLEGFARRVNRRHAREVLGCYGEHTIKKIWETGIFTAPPIVYSGLYSSFFNGRSNSGLTIPYLKVDGIRPWAEWTEELSSFLFNLN